MNHLQLVQVCEARALKVERRTNSPSGAPQYNATDGNIRVYWTKSTVSNALIGLPRIARGVTDTHTSTIAGLTYLIAEYRKPQTKETTCP